jgi:hypothetical protein
MTQTQTSTRYMNTSNLQEFLAFLGRCLQLPENFGNCHLYEEFLIASQELSSREEVN